MIHRRTPLGPLRAMEAGILAGILLVGGIAWAAALLTVLGFALGLIMSSPSLAVMMTVFVVIVLVAKAAIQVSIGHRPASGLR